MPHFIKICIKTDIPLVFGEQIDQDSLVALLIRHFM